MAGDRENGDALERIAASVAALVALTVAQMTDPETGKRKKPWTQQDLIIALNRGGLRSKDIVTALGTTRNAVDPVLSRYRKAKEKKPAAAVAPVDAE
jgi:hypothetical protein